MAKAAAANGAAAAAAGAEDEGEGEDELGRLRREVLRLRKENAALSGCTYVLREGVLMRYRESVLSQSWKKRFYDLVVGPEGATLRCFETRGETDAHSKRGKERISVSIGSDVEILRETGAQQSVKDGHPLHCFQLKLPPGAGPMKVLRLGADSEEQLNTWIEAFETAAAQREGGLPRQESQGSLQRQASRQIQPGPPKLDKHVELSALRPVHTAARVSVLTSEDGRGIPDCNVIGILNLSVTVLVVVHLRLVTDNLRKYGLLLDPLRHVGDVSSNPAHLNCLLCLLACPLFALAALGCERAASTGIFPDAVARAVHALNCVLALGVPIAVIRNDPATAPPVGMALLMAGTVLFLKLVSFAHVNHALRMSLRLKKQGSKDGEDDSNGKQAAVSGSATAYPSNLTLRNVSSFMAFPTLVYQTDYPRTERIRKRWLAKRFVELLVCLVLMSVIAEQFVAPTLKNSSMPVLSYDVAGTLIAIMKLALPNVYLWLFMFYALFHLWLNILAELTYFGDRLFYKEWWNATKLEDYWRLWNLPVHNWLVKHVFLPTINCGLGKPAAVFGTFFVSAVFHEVLVSVPCHTFRLWSFFGMMAQLPLVHLTAAIDRRLKGSQLGNLIFWISFCIVGQPLCVLLYFAQV